MLTTNIKFQSIAPIQIESKRTNNKVIWTITETKAKPDNLQYYDFWICGFCGSDDIRQLSFVDPNTEEVFECKSGQDTEYCNNCGSFVSFDCVQMPDTQRILWTVETYSLGDKWKNCWSEYDADTDTTTPTTFETSEEAMTAINEHLDEFKEGYCREHGWNACTDDCPPANGEDLDSEREQLRLQPIPLDNPYLNFAHVSENLPDTLPTPETIAKQIVASEKGELN